MTRTEGANLVGGTRVRSRAGRFDLREGAEPWGPLGSWPLSSEADVADALDALARADSRVARPADVLSVVAHAAADLEADGAERRTLARRIGVDARDLPHDDLAGAVHDLRAGAAGRGVLRAGDARRASPNGIAVLLLDWSELFLGPLVEIARHLLLGRSLLVLPDPRAPMAADAVVSALLDAGGDAQRVAVVHGAFDGAGVRVALEDERVVAVSASGRRARIALLRGLVPASCEARLRVLRARAAVVAPEVGLDREARRLVAAAFGRSETLSGQRDGQVGRIYCPARSFSRFTELFLATLAASPADTDPVPAIDRAAAEAVRRAWAAGLDEGAALIAGGERFGGDTNFAELRLRPTVFTNVDVTARVLLRQAPMPIVCLVRTPENAG